MRKSSHFFIVHWLCCMRLYLANVGVTTCNAFEGFWRELPPRSPRRRKWHINYILTFHSRYKFATANCWPPAFSGWSPNPPSANPVYLTVCHWLFHICICICICIYIYLYQYLNLNLHLHLWSWFSPHMTSIFAQWQKSVGCQFAWVWVRAILQCALFWQWNPAAAGAIHLHSLHWV